jgi:hypothetical protein
VGIVVWLLLICKLQTAQVYYAGKTRYIRLFDSREEAAFASEIAREKLSQETLQRHFVEEEAEAAIPSARKAALEAYSPFRIYRS